MGLEGGGRNGGSDTETGRIRHLFRGALPGGELAPCGGSLSPEFRLAGIFGAGDGPAIDEAARPPGAEVRSAPAYRWGGGAAEAFLQAVGERTQRGWRVLFSRPLDVGEGRQAFRPGAQYHFGIALFDNTTFDHHIVRDTQLFTLVVPPS